MSIENIRILGAETTGETTATTAEHEAHNSFYGNKDELIWGTAAFLILFALFIWKGVPVIKKVAAARTQRISDEITAAEAGKAEAEAELSVLQASLGNAAVDAEAIVAEARTRADTVKADLLARVEADVDASKQRTRIEIEASKQQAFADLQAEVAAMTVTATNAVVTENLTDAVKADLIEQFITQLGATHA
jgi:F-type H+-transporting ATPase subunit b